MTTKIAHFFPKEFLYRNWHYEPGWYFYDEEGDLYGPFVSEAHCNRGFQLYLQQLNLGVAPTQINRSDLLSDPAAED